MATLENSIISDSNWKPNSCNDKTLFDKQSKIIYTLFSAGLKLSL